MNRNRPRNLSATVLQYIQDHPGCYASDVARDLQPLFPDRSPKALQSVPSQLRFRGKVRFVTGRGYVAVDTSYTTEGVQK